MTPAIYLLVGGLVLLSIVPLARYLDSRAWRSHLIAYELSLPSKLTIDNVANWLSNIAAITHAPRYSLLSLPPVGFELVASSRQIRFYVITVTQAKAKTLAGLRFALPGVRIEETPEYLTAQPDYRVAAELRTTNDHRPLATERAEFTAGSLLSALYPVPPGGEVYVQWWLVSGGTPRPIPSTSGNGSSSQSSWPVGQGFLQDSEAIRAARMKQASPYLRLPTGRSDRAALRYRR